jgi:hypothetical protein
MIMERSHPPFIAGMEERVVARPFEPATPLDFLLCVVRDARNAQLISEFANETKAMAARRRRPEERSLGPAFRQSFRPLSREPRWLAGALAPDGVPVDPNAIKELDALPLGESQRAA